MKKSLLLVATLLLSTTIYCQYDSRLEHRRELQSPYKNSLAVTMQFDSWSWGARYERRESVLGGYAYALKGDFPDNPSAIRDEVTVGMGLVIAPAEWYYGYYPGFTIGINYSEYTYYDAIDPVDTPADDMMSIDLGISAQHERVNMGFKADILKWTMRIFVGVNF